MSSQSYKFAPFLKRLTSGDKRSVKAKKNIIGSILVKGISIVVQLLLVPLTLGYLNSELYGIWLTLSSIILWINFFDVGFTLGLKNRLAEAIAKNDMIRAKSLVSTTYAMLILIFVPLCIIGECLIPLINWSEFLNVSASLNGQLIDVMRILMLSFCFQMISNVIGAVLAANQQVALSSVLPVIGNILSLAVIWILKLTVPASLTVLALSISFIPAFVFCLSSVSLFRGKFNSISPTVSSIDFSLVKDLFNLGASFFIIQIQIVILYQSTNILISNISSPEQVSAYNIAYRYIGVAAMLFTLILGPLWPAFTDAYAKKEFTWMRNVYNKMTKLYAFTFIGIIVMVIIAPYIYHIWIGNETTISTIMTITVGIYVAIHSWDSLQVYLLNGIGAVKLQSYVTLIGLFLHIPLSFLLGKHFHLGAIGVIASMIVINIIYSTVFTIQLRRILYTNHHE